MTIIRTLLATALLGLTTAGCAAIPAAIPNTPVVDNGPVAPVGSLVRLGQPVWIDPELVATPVEVHEDSRCPMNARCVWAGRAVVLTRIDGAGWRERAYLTLGEPYATHGTTLTLTSVQPEQVAGSEIAIGDYRFAYEGGN